MARIILNIRTDEVHADGTCRLLLQVSHKQRTAYHRLHIAVNTSKWSNGHIIGNPHAEDTAQKILMEARIALHEVEQSTDIATLTPTQLRDRILEVMMPTTREAVPRDYLLPLFDRKIATLPATRSRQLYGVTKRKVQHYAPNADTLRVSDLTVEWLRLFDLWMQNHGTPSRNARNIDLRNLRAVCNFAIDDGLTQNYPFRRFRIKPQETAKRALSVEQLRALIRADLTPPRSVARDIFVLSFMLLGINPADLFDLRKVVRGRIQYTRHKTGKLYDVAVPDAALPLLARYAGRTKLVSVCEDYANARVFNAAMNAALQRIHIPELGDTLLTMYYARHTWATIAASLDIPTDTIALALGHGQRSVTDIYIKKDLAKVDEANLRVIAHVLTV